MSLFDGTPYYGVMELMGIRHSGAGGTAMVNYELQIIKNIKRMTNSDLRYMIDEVIKIRCSSFVTLQLS